MKKFNNTLQSQHRFGVKHVKFIESNLDATVNTKRDCCKKKACFNIHAHNPYTCGHPVIIPSVCEEENHEHQNHEHHEQEHQNDTCDVSEKEDTCVEQEECLNFEDIYDKEEQSFSVIKEDIELPKQPCIDNVKLNSRQFLRKQISASW